MASTVQNITSTSHSQHNTEDMEISLIDISKVLYRRKKLIMLVIGIVVFAGMFYAFSKERVYEVETILLSSSVKDLQSINVLKNNVNSHDILEKFIATFQSRRLKKEFFEKFKVLESILGEVPKLNRDLVINGVFEKFADSFKISSDKDFVRIKLIGTDKQNIGIWLDGIVEMANKKTIQVLVDSLENEVDTEIKSLNLEMEVMRESYLRKRDDELAILNEALSIAKELGINKYSFNPSASYDSRTSAVNAASHNSPIFMKGTRVLKAEIKNLKQRKLNDIHIFGLRELQEKVARLEKTKIARADAIKNMKNNLRAVTVEQNGVQSTVLIKPNKRLYLILSLVVGVMLGVFCALIFEFIKNSKNIVRETKIISE